MGKRVSKVSILQENLKNGDLETTHWQAGFRKSLRAYVQDYLKEEVFDEGLTRNIPAFSRFFDAMGYSHGELTNYSNIARDCGVDARTVKEYCQILVDTLLGRMVTPFKKRQERQVVSKASKFYLFDVGVAGDISRRHLEEEKGELFGKALVICNERKERLLGRIRIMPWKTFLTDLWKGKIIH